MSPQVEMSLVKSLPTISQIKDMVRKAGYNVPGVDSGADQYRRMLDFAQTIDAPLYVEEAKNLNKQQIAQELLCDFQASGETFLTTEDIEKLRSMGFAKGGSLDNAIVVKGSKLLNNEGLRSEKEFVNHKILDCMGDLFLSGYKIIAKIKCSQGGHKLTNDLLRKVFQNKDNYSILEINEKNVPHSLVNKQNLRSIA